MDAITGDYWYFVVHIIYLGLFREAHFHGALNVAVKLEEGMTLDCVCPWSGNLSMVSWTKAPNKMPVAVYHPEFGQETSMAYTGRVTFRMSSPLDGSIYVTNVTDQDVGLYQCSMQTFPLGSWNNEVLVKKGKFVQVKPATDVSVRRGDRFTIRCRKVNNDTVSQVSFEKIGEKTIETLAMCKYLTNGSLKGIKYRQSIKVNCSSTMDASFQLSNMTEDDGGLYRCFYNTDIEGQTMMVTVYEEGALRFSQSMTYIYIGSGAAGFVLILVLISALVWCRRRKKQKAKVKTKVHPIQRRLLNNYEQTAPHVKTKKRTKQHEEPIYCNIANQPRRTKRKT